MNITRDAVLPIPENINPPDTICLQIQVPNDTRHIAAFVGQVQYLTNWWAWDRDDAHSGKQLAAIWLAVLNGITTCAGEPISKILGMEVEEMSVLRVDCDCNVWVTCCDGTQKQILTGDQVKALIQSQPAQGAPQPAPGGGCVSYSGSITGNGRYLLPTLLNTGDTVTVTAQGASQGDGYSHWNCPDGSQFFLNACLPVSNTHPSDLLPTVPSGCLLINISGTYYHLNGAFTVPAGVTNEQAFICLNYDPTVQAYGSITLSDVEVCNNTVATFTHNFDFTLSNYGWVPNDTFQGDPVLYTHYAPGSGFVADCTTVHGASQTFAIASLPLTTPVEITEITVFYTASLGTGAHLSPIRFFYNADANFDEYLATLLAGNQSATEDDVNNRMCSRLYFQMVAAAGGGGCPDGAVTVTGVQVKGYGIDPF